MKEFYCQHTNLLLCEDFLSKHTRTLSHRPQNIQQKTVMAFIWRRRSTSIVKIIAILTAIWFFVAFFIYTDDTRRENANNKWNVVSQQLKSFASAGSANANNQINNFERDGAGAFEAGAGFGMPNNNMPLERNHKARQHADEDDGGAVAAADIPIAVPDSPNNAANEPNADDNDINEGDESIVNNVVVNPNGKLQRGKLIAGRKENANERAADDGKCRFSFLYSYASISKHFNNKSHF